MHPALETLVHPFREGLWPLPGSCLFLHAHPHPVLDAIPRRLAWQPLKPAADACSRAGWPLAERPSGSWPAVFLLPGKSRDETLASFALAHDLLAPGGTLVAALANDCGASRFEKELRRAAPRVESFSKHKARVFRASLDRPWCPETLLSWRQLGQPRRLDPLPFTTAPGIFSPDHPDPGSAFLVEHLPASLHGRVADLGAGWGFLSHHLARSCPKITGIDLYEADSRALDCARLNVADPRARFFWHDVTAGLPGSYDAIVANPPFHTGKTADPELGRDFLRSAAAALRAGGRLFVVANRQLPYESTLDELLLHWHSPASNPTFKLLFARKS